MSESELLCRKFQLESNTWKQQLNGTIARVLTERETVVDPEQTASEDAHAGLVARVGRCGDGRLAGRRWRGRRGGVQSFAGTRCGLVGSAAVQQIAVVSRFQADQPVSAREPLAAVIFQPVFAGIQVRISGVEEAGTVPLKQQFPV